MSQKADRVSLLSRARVPHVISSTQQLIEQGKAGVVTHIAVTGGAADTTVELRDGDATGDLIYSMSAATGADDDRTFPQGLFFADGLHVTIPGGDEIVNIVASD